MSQVQVTATCRCGCGEEVAPGKIFRHGHWAKTQLRKDRGLRPFCRCGCGRETNWRGRTHGGWSKYAPGCRVRKPPHPPWVDDDPEFWAWFAGFTDGEGCFGIVVSTTGGKRYPQPYFKIAVRADERPILKEIQRRLECGRVRIHVPGALTSNLQLKFEMSSVADCRRLIEVFRAHPLRAKKARDFETWALAVEAKGVSAASAEVFALREQLIAGRQYDPQLAEEVMPTERLNAQNPVA